MAELTTNRKKRVLTNAQIFESGKLPPQAPELEQAVLGALLLEKDAINVITEVLKADSFYDPKHKNIYEAIVNLWQNGSAVDILTVSQELKKQGTLELLLTKPLSIWQIVNGKFLGAFLLIVIAIIPTFIYVKVISTLGMPEGNIDMGSTFGSYFGLLFLISAYSAIGIFTSTLSENQIVAFILSVFLSFFFYFGFEGLSTYLPSFENFISSLGMENHFKSMSRGVLDTRDITYFFSVTILFLSLTVYKLKSMKL
jgi:ABC-2 type transport system permease protein